MKRTAMAAMLLLIAFGVNAEDDAGEWRIGGSVSFSDYDRDDRLIRDSSTGFKAHAQYRFNSWVGVEGAFYVSPDFEDDANPSAAGGEAETSYQGVTLHGIGYIPMPGDRVDFFVKGGYANFFDVDLKVDGSTVDSGSEDGITLGAGFAIEATDNVGIRIEYDWYDVSGADLYSIGIGAEYRF